MPSTNKICPICGRKTNTLRTGVKNGEYLSERCETCLANHSHISDYARKYNRDRGRRDFGKDIIQRYEGTEINEEFVREYPAEAEAQWGPDVLRDYGKKRSQF